MKTTVQVGGVIDIATSDEIRKSADSIVERLLRPKTRGVWVRKVDSVIYPSATTGAHVLEMNTPPQGKVWLINRIELVVVDQTTGAYLAYNLTNWQAVAFVGNRPDRLTGTTVQGRPSPAALVGVMPLAFNQPYPVAANDELFVLLNVTAAFTNAVQVTAVATVYETDDVNALQRGM